MNQRLLSLLVLTLASAPAAALAETTGDASTGSSSVTAHPAPASARRGFTLEVGLGLGATYETWEVQPGDDAPASGLHVPAIDLGLGAWLTDRVAVTLRTAVTVPSGDSFSTTFVGPSVQYQLNDRIFVGGGAGLGIIGAVVTDPGLGLDARAGYDLLGHGRHAVQLGLEVTPVFAWGVTTVSASANLGWQLL